MTRAVRLLHVARTGVRTLRSGDFGVTLATVQDGVDLRAFEHLARVMAASAEGRSLLDQRPRLSLASLERAGAASLPEGTLGRSVYEHLARNGLLRDLLIPESPFPLPPDAAYAKARWRETHDLRHVLCGLGVSVRDEIVLQAFQLGQFHNRFALLQMTFGPLVAPCRPDHLARDYRRAWRAGRRAAPLAGIRWEDRLGDRVAEVRAALRIERLGDLWT